jgi:hypothetical protein
VSHVSPVTAAALTSSLAERVRPVTLAEDQLLPVDQALEGLLPRSGLVRGTTVAVEGPLAATSLALALVARASSAGSWVAVVGLPSLGLAAAEGLGLQLERLVVVAPPEPGQWAAVVATLAEGFDVVLAGPPVRTRPQDARRLVARVRERRSVLVQVGWPPNRWPEEPELVLGTSAACWEGIGVGWGHCRARRVAVTVRGRRAAGRPSRAWLWLPGSDGRLQRADPPGGGDVVFPAAAASGAARAAGAGGAVDASMGSAVRPRLNLVQGRRRR